MAQTAKASGRISTAFWRLFQASESRPTISGDHISPNRWIMKIEAAIALERRFTGTASIINVFTGPVERNSRNIAVARQAMATPRLETRKAAAEIGTATSTERPSVQA